MCPNYFDIIDVPVYWYGYGQTVRAAVAASKKDDDLTRIFVREQYQ